MSQLEDIRSQMGQLEYASQDFAIITVKFSGLLAADSSSFNFLEQLL